MIRSVTSGVYLQTLPYRSTLLQHADNYVPSFPCYTAHQNGSRACQIQIFTNQTKKHFGCNLLICHRNVGLPFEFLIIDLAPCAQHVCLIMHCWQVKDGAKTIFSCHKPCPFCVLFMHEFCEQCSVPKVGFSACLVNSGSENTGLAHNRFHEKHNPETKQKHQKNNKTKTYTQN